MSKPIHQSDLIPVLSEQLLLAVKKEVVFDSIAQNLAELDLTNLQAALNNDKRKKAFWVNIYNAYFIILRKYQGIDKKAIFKSKLITIAQQKFSLDDIEHGILRKYRYKYSLGYLPNIFTKRLIKRLAVKKLDYRIHFALNCGAKSCPPIAFYKVNAVEQQLSIAESSFLENNTNIDHTKKVIHTSKILQWFIGDFGGKRGIRKLMKQVLKEDVKRYKIQYNRYDWEEDLDNFI